MFLLVSSSIKGTVAEVALVLLEFAMHCFDVRLKFFLFVTHMWTVFAWVVLRLFMNCLDVHLKP